MVKHIQKIRHHLSMSDHFLGLALKGLRFKQLLDWTWKIQFRWLGFFFCSPGLEVTVEGNRKMATFSKISFTITERWSESNLYPAPDPQLLLILIFLSKFTKIMSRLCCYFKYRYFLLMSSYVKTMLHLWKNC